jgi:hypothetical protein
MFAELYDLKHLHLSGNKLNAAAIKAFRQALPDCEIN